MHDSSLAAAFLLDILPWMIVIGLAVYLYRTRGAPRRAAAPTAAVVAGTTDNTVIRRAIGLPDSTNPVLVDLKLVADKAAKSEEVARLVSELLDASVRTVDVYKNISLLRKKTELMDDVLEAMRGLLGDHSGLVVNTPEQCIKVLMTLTGESTAFVSKVLLAHEPLGAVFQQHSIDRAREAIPHVFGVFERDTYNQAVLKGTANVETQHRLFLEKGNENLGKIAESQGRMLETAQASVENSFMTLTKGLDAAANLEARKGKPSAVAIEAAEQRGRANTAEKALTKALEQPNVIQLVQSGNQSGNQQGGNRNRTTGNQPPAQNTTPSTSAADTATGT